MSIRQASEMTNIPLTTLSRKLRGNPFNLDDLDAVAKALHMPLDELMVRVLATGSTKEQES